MLDDPHTFSALSSALALLLGLLWVSGIFGRVRKLKQTSQVPKLNQGGCPPAEATVASDKQVWEVPHDIGELTVSKLLVHPIKVCDASLWPTRESAEVVTCTAESRAELSRDVAFGSKVYA